MSKKVLILLADGFEEVEALSPYDVLTRAGAEVTLCSVSEDKAVSSSHKVKVVCDITIGEVKGDYDVVFLPGGMPGATNLAQSWPVNELVINQAQERIVAAICASPAVVLGPAGLLKGKEATCYPGCESYYPSFEFSKEGVVVSGNIITAKSAAFALDLGFTLIETLFGAQAAEKIKNDIYYN